MFRGFKSVLILKKKKESLMDVHLFGSLRDTNNIGQKK